MNKQTAAIIIPTFNERENIQDLVKKILTLRIPKLVLIIVDDNSPDGTGDIADKQAKKYKNVFVVHRPKKLGLGTAYVAGFDLAFKKGASVVMTMDADFSHDPKSILAILNRIGEYDVVIGSRHIKGGKIIGFNTWRHFVSQSAQAFSRILLRTPVFDSSSGFRAYKKEVIEKVHFEKIKSHGYSFLIEAIYRCHKKGFKIAEVPITFRSRTKGKSKLSQSEIFKALKTVIRLRMNDN